MDNIVLILYKFFHYTYQFIRLYCLHLYHQQRDIPDLDEEFISYCMITMGTRDNRGKKPVHTDLLIELNQFYEHCY